MKLAALALAAVVASAGVARADADLVSANAISGLLDLRTAAASGETSWTDGGFGKLRFGRGDDPSAEVADAALIWKPRFSWAISGYVSVEHQPEQDHAVDLTEAFLTIKPAPASSLSYSARIGLFWPQVSLEHDGPAWSVSRTITPSAIDSWVSEEIKTLAAEATVRHTGPEGVLTAQAAIFAADDTAGALLTFRGWALHDVRATAFGSLPLPPLSAFAIPRQPDETYIGRDLDGRPGFYGRLQWRPPAPLSVEVFYFDNRGDPHAVASDEQWAWRTRFWNVGARITPDASTQILAQAMSGTTRMGYDFDGSIWFEDAFASAYVLASRQLGRSLVTARGELFRVHDRTLVQLDDNDEHGWAATAAWRYDLSHHAQLFVEALHVDSERPARVLAFESPRQRQTQVQTALRLHF